MSYASTLCGIKAIVIGFGLAKPGSTVGRKRQVCGIDGGANRCQHNEICQRTGNHTELIRNHDLVISGVEPLCALNSVSVIRRIWYVRSVKLPLIAKLRTHCHDVQCGPVGEKNR